MKTIFKRELNAYFRSPVAYCVIGFFMIITGYFFWRVNIIAGSVEFEATLSGLTTYLVFLCPVITMKLLADEKKNGTEVLLRTTPISFWQIVLGKFFAAFVVLFIMVALTLVYPIIMSIIVGTSGTVPWLAIIGGYLAFILMGASFLSIGMLTSSMTENQIVAAVSGIVLLLAMLYTQQVGAVVGGTWGKILIWISLSSRYNDFAAGAFNIASLIFYIVFTAVVLFVTIMNMERKRWN